MPLKGCTVARFMQGRPLTNLLCALYLGHAHLSVHQLKDACSQLNIELAVKTERLHALEMECNLLRQNVLGQHEGSAIDYYQPIVQQYAEQVAQLQAQIAVQGEAGAEWPPRHTAFGIVHANAAPGADEAFSLNGPKGQAHDFTQGDFDFVPRGAVGVGDPEG